jgi:hypothetical protein
MQAYTHTITNTMDLGGIRKKSYSAKSSHSDASSVHHYSMVLRCTPSAPSTKNSRIISSPGPLVWKGYNRVLYAIEAFSNFNHSRSKAYFVILARQVHRTYRLDPAPVAISEARRLRVCLVARVGYLTSTKLDSAVPTSHKYVLLYVFGRLYYLSIAWLR